jgi:hypothetical protein
VSDKKTCLRFKRTAAGRRCAKFDGSYSSQRGAGRTCVRFKTTGKGKRCAKYGEKD